MKTLTVELAARSYPIHIGAGLLDDADLLTARVDSRQVLLISNETVAPLYLERVRRAFADYDALELVLPDGEQYKTMATLERIFDALLAARFSRDCTLVALGGGVIGDVVGFAAACYQRGVAFLQLPTTLLAQVDSSVGGKTAVNHLRGKNMIGAFHQPVAVIADTTALASLPPRELRAGLAEVIKYGLIRDPGFHAWLEQHIGDLLRGDPDALAEAVHRSCRNKAEVVAADERESGERALLNLGHTFGHAIEAGLGYGVWLHGEAVAAGMCLAAELSHRLGLLDIESVQRVCKLIARADLPTAPPREIAPARLIELMAVDKKARGGRVRFVVMKAIGEAIVTDEVDSEQLDALLTEAMRAA